jgi:hypothetical protein
VKRRDLIRRLISAAKLLDGSSIGIDTRGKDDKLLHKDLRVPLPMLNEISDGTTAAIFKAFESYFGEDWWRNDQN